VVTFREPGEGAINYAIYIVENYDDSKLKNREDLLNLMYAIMTQMPPHKRVKRCEYCGYVWYDDSLRNTKKTCSAECKTGIKTLQRRMQRADRALLQRKPRKKTKKEINYIWWLEYPFWLDEYEMLKHSWKYEIPKDVEVMTFIDANNQIYGTGNRRKKVIKPGYEDTQAGQRFYKLCVNKLRTG